VSKFYVEGPEQLYGCYRCGEIMGEIRESDSSTGWTCESCGEPAVMSFLNALDILNDLYIRGDLQLNGEDIYIDDFIEED